MSDLLFIELGAVVTEVQGQTVCTFEPFCTPQPPTYAAQSRIKADFARSLDNVLVTGAPEEAEYDQYIGPPNAEGRVSGSLPVGPSWPGAAYEGVVRVRADLVAGSPALAAAAAALPGQPYEYQVVASVDAQTKAVRRYHGYYAEVLRTEGSVLVLRVAHGGSAAERRWAPTEVPYDPANTDKFYSGPLVADQLVGGGADPRGTGAVFIALDVASGDYLIGDPKQPPGAGL
ncbi:MAG TPA: hypothetical protein VNO30_42735 [Kofleriaceae bacterium]|nr:hypothetical protein [Kofleriaceae bacterium]